MDLNLTNQVAVVIGGASGIGLATAQAFAAEGAVVAILDRNPAAAEIAAEIGRETSVATYGGILDATDFEAVRRAVDDIEAALGPVVHVANTAAIGSGKGGFPFWNLQPEDWRAVLGVNILGAVNIAHAFSPGMVERRQGSFLFLGSVAGQIGSQTDPPYSASKAAILNFVQCMAKDLAPHNVRANVLNPGMVSTPLQARVYAGQVAHLPVDQRPSYEEWAAEKIGRLVPLNRWQTPEDIANMIIFLASDRARNVTGQSINVDGGWVMHW
ncbi:MAG: SDR family oxidoreductase [Caldilineaceae bacterium]|nr:SDR family oxidoreductase [Caldilineaceae bacterium]